MADHKHNHASCESCETIKNEEKEKLKEDLKKCAAARSVAEDEKKAQLEKTALEAEEKVEKMKKQLMAFQLATVVGVTILGQEAFDKIFSKVEEVKSVQNKITGMTSDGETEEKSSGKTEKPKTSTKSVGFVPFLPKTPLDWSEFSKFDNRIVITSDKMDHNVPWIPEQTQIASSLTGSGTQILVDPPISQPPSLNSITLYDFPVATLDILGLISLIQYPLLPFQDSPFVYGQNITLVPSGRTLPVLALFGIADCFAAKRRV